MENDTPLSEDEEEEDTMCNFLKENYSLLDFLNCEKNVTWNNA